MASRPGRKINSWKSAEGRLCRCVATHLFRDGVGRAELLRRFRQTVPDYARYFPNPVSDQSIWMRGYLGSKPGYEHEHPDRNPANAEFWARARKALDNITQLGIERRDGEAFLVETF